MDSVGAGELPDAGSYGDQGSNTLGNIAKRVPLHLPALRSLGLARVADLGAGGKAVAERGAFGRMAEASAGKDSVTGHWEMMGIVLDRAFPTFPDGFPADVIAEFSDERRAVALERRPSVIAKPKVLAAPTPAKAPPRKGKEDNASDWESF